MSLPALALLALVSSARAQDAVDVSPGEAESPPPAAAPDTPPPDAAEPPAPEATDTSSAEDDDTLTEIVVFGEMEIARRRRALNNRLRTQGYTEKKKKRDGTAVWRPEAPWKASVEVHDEGFVMMKRSPVRFDSYIKGKSPARWIGCIPPFIVMCVRVGGQVVSKTKLDAQKNRLATAMDEELDAWKEAVTATSMKRRIEEQLPAAIEATWTEGAPFEGSPPLPTPADRRAALLEFWSDRACTPEGTLVSRAVADFLELEVQSSPHPVTPEELQGANARATCGRTLTLPMPTPGEVAAP